MILAGLYLQESREDVKGRNLEKTGFKYNYLLILACENLFIIDYADSILFPVLRHFCSFLQT